MQVNKQTQRSEATRAKLMRAARPLFARRGYSDVGTEEIVRRAGVTRGALYHHFDGKEGLFESVYRQVEIELTQTIAAQAAAASSPAEALRLGAESFLDAVREPEIQRIVILDAPAVLGWERWREIGLEHGLGLVEAVLQAGVDAGQIEPQPVRALAHILLGAMDEAALLVARAPDPVATRAEVSEVIGRVLDALLAPRTP